jgi:hypothetical protein
VRIVRGNPLKGVCEITDLSVEGFQGRFLVGGIVHQGSKYDAGDKEDGEGSEDVENILSTCLQNIIVQVQKQNLFWVTLG